MSRRALGGAVVMGMALVCMGFAGAVVAGGLQDSPPQDAQPADPIGDILRNAPPVESAPAGVPAPSKPVAIIPADPVDLTVVAPAEEAADVEAAAKDDAATPAAEKIVEPDVPLPRQRRRVAIIEAIDKIPAERMRFEVVVGGRPVRFNNSLIFSARACEVSADNELVADAIAYMDVSLQSRGTAQPTEARQIFRGWMFASTPGVSGLQHPIYDAWVVGCKA
ncbi:DUF2155 domain-containing protein [soil metagenome]